MLESFGSLPYGNVAPAPVITRPASFALATIALAHPSMESKEMKYPPRRCDPGTNLQSAKLCVPEYQVPASNFGRMMSACFFICSLIPCRGYLQSNRAWRSWFNLVMADGLDGHLLAARQSRLASGCCHGSRYRHLQS